MCMLLAVRSAEAGDLDACYGLLPEGFICPAGLRERLVPMWRELMRRGELVMNVVEDASRPARVVGFSALGFVTEEFARFLIRPGAEPYIAAQAACRWASAAHSSPFLSASDVRRVNSGESGLIALVLHEGIAPPAVCADGDAVRAKLQETLIASLSGYYLRAMLWEVYGQAESQRAVAFGARVLRSYKHRPGSGQARPGREPHLMAVSRCKLTAGSYAASLFYNSRPRLYLTAAEQELAKLALLDRTDDEIAATLCVSSAAVHKRWAGLYARVGDRAPDLLGGSRVDLPRSGASRRGTEKRRSLLGYLRQHPEELRPVEPQEDGRSAPRAPRGGISGTTI